MGGPVGLVLLVDVATTLRQLARMTLELAPGWLVVGEAGDGDDAIALAGDLRPDVIVPDQQMPRMSGTTALPQLRALCPDSVIVMWSSEPGVRHQALTGGADAFIEKGDPLSS